MLGFLGGVDAPFGAVAAAVGVPVLEDGATAPLGSRTQSATVIDGGAHQDASRSGSTQCRQTASGVAGRVRSNAKVRPSAHRSRSATADSASMAAR